MFRNYRILIRIFVLKICVIVYYIFVLKVCPVFTLSSFRYTELHTTLCAFVLGGSRNTGGAPGKSLSARELPVFEPVQLKIHGTAMCDHGPCPLGELGNLISDDVIFSQNT